MQRLRLPESTPADVEVWRLELDLHASVTATDWAVLSDDERVRASRFQINSDRVRSVATRAALRRLLAERMGQASHRLRFCMNRHGKPYLEEENNIHFNVSHAGDFALIALSGDGVVGVDIEVCDPRTDVRGIAEHVFSPLEREAGATSPEDFFRRWVVKESVLKALGVGIAEHLKDISVLLGECESHRVVHDNGKWTDIQACSLDAPLGYAAGLAWLNRSGNRKVTKSYESF